jgi:thiamine-phosphate pyrophosphorylase
MTDNLAAVLRLLLVTDDALLAGRDPLVTCQAAVSGGVTAVQLRLKHASDREFLSLARRLVGELSVPVFINDRLDIALAAGARGVHLGPEDISPVLARRIAPTPFVIGASVGADTEIERGLAADYWGVGPFRTTITKGDAGTPLGIAGVARLLERSGGRPCVAIGGVLPQDVALIRRAGFAGVAVVSGILAAANPAAAAGDYRAGERGENAGEGAT